MMKVCLIQYIISLQAASEFINPPKTLTKEGIYYYIIIPRFNFDDDIKNIDNIKFIYINMPLTLRYSLLNLVIFNVLVITKLITSKVNDIDIFHIYPNSSFAGYFLSFYYKIPYLIDYQAPWSLQERNFNKDGIPNRIKYYTLLLVEHIINSRSSGYIFISENIKKYYFKNGINKPFELIPMGVRKDWLIYKKKIRYNQNCLKGCYIGNIGFERKLDVILDALKILKSKDINIKFLFIGNGNSLEDLKMKAEKYELSNVTFMGYIDQKFIPSVVADCDFGISYVPYSENFDMCPPLKTIEYMGMGLVVIATNLKSHLIYIEDFKTGLLIENDNPEELYEKICLLYNNESLINFISTNAMSFALSNFTWEKLADKYKRLYHKIYNS